MLAFIQRKRFLQAALAALAYAGLTGCALNMPVPVKDPVPSTQRFQAADAKPAVIQFFDAQTAEAREKMVTGRIPMKPMYQDKPLEATDWLARNTVAELAARGLPAKLAENGATAADVVRVRLINSTNHRVSGFSPFETYTRFSADLVTGSGSKRVAFWIKRGKVPVWSFNEVIDPTFNEPLDLLSKDLAAQIARQIFKASFSDAQVDTIVGRIEAAGKDVNFRDVFELGFGNNKRAIPALVRLTTHGSDEISHAAISSLGLLDATDQFASFRTMYETAKSDKEDRGIALKALCDLSSTEARNYVREQMAALKDKQDDESRFFIDIISLYL